MVAPSFRPPTNLNSDQAPTGGCCTFSQMDARSCARGDGRARSEISADAATSWRSMTGSVESGEACK